MHKKTKIIAASLIIIGILLVVFYPNFLFFNSNSETGMQDKLPQPEANSVYCIELQEIKNSGSNACLSAQW